jgi:hypothetical protein
MPSQRCSVCGTYHTYPTHVSEMLFCLVCYKPFCKQCKTSPFLCSRCASALPSSVPDELKATMGNHEQLINNSVIFSTIGIILLPTTILVLLLASALNCYYCHPAIIRISYLWPILQPILGLIFIITGGSMRYNNRMSMSRKARDILHQYKALNPQFMLHGTRDPQPAYYGDHGGAQGSNVYQGTQPQHQAASWQAPPAWSISAPAVPNSAFIPPPGEQQYTKPPASPSASTPSTQTLSPIDLSKAKSKAAQPGTYANLTYCGQCGEQLPNVADLQFCPSCGQQLAHE